MFEPLPLDNMNEADVREDILTPLIMYLGYRIGTIHNVIREQPLRYPRAFLGRKDLKRDPILRGKADYILEAYGKIRWVIEAKAANVEFSTDDIEQAWSYANHPEVRAVYFVLSNGKTLQIFQTNRAPASKPIYSITFAEFNEKFSQLKNILSPDSLMRDYPDITPDYAEPLGTGLRSIVRIANGLLKYERNTLNIPALNQLQISILGDAVERDETGHMIAQLRTMAPIQHFQELNERLGLTTFEMICADRTISDNPEKPSIFSYEKTIQFPKGEQILDIQTWKKTILPINISSITRARAQGFLKDNKFIGQFITEINVLETKQKNHAVGSFILFLL